MCNKWLFTKFNVYPLTVGISSHMHNTDKNGKYGLQNICEKCTSRVYVTPPHYVYDTTGLEAMMRMCNNRNSDEDV